MDTSIVIGGVEYTLKPMRFSQLLTVSPLLDRMLEPTVGFNKIETGLEIIAVGIGGVNADQLQDLLFVTEMEGVMTGVSAWLDASGLKPKTEASASGEAVAVS